MRLSSFTTHTVTLALMILAVACTTAVAQYQGGIWRPAAGPYGGRINALIAAEDGSIVAGTTGGFYRSTNNGVSWDMADGSSPPVSVNAFARDSAGILYAATRYGVYRSINNGGTWTLVALPDWDLWSIAILNRTEVLAGGHQTIHKIVPSSGDTMTFSYNFNHWTFVSALAVQNGIIYAGTVDDGMFESYDGGLSLTGISDFPCDRAVKVIVPRAIDSSTVALTVGTSCGLYSWNTVSRTWTEYPGPLSGRDVASVKLIDGDIYAGTRGYGIFRQVAHTGEWIEIYNGIEHNYINAIEGMLNGYIYCGTMHGVQRTENYGDRWESVNNGIRATNVRSVKINPKGYLFACTETGIYRSMDKGATWKEKNYLLLDRDVFCMALDAKGNIWAGTWHGRLFGSTDDGDSWSERPFTTTDPIRAIGFDAEGNMLVAMAGSDRRLYTNRTVAPGWRDVLKGTVLGIVSVGSSLYANMWGTGLLESRDNGETWPYNVNFSRAYNALDASPKGKIVIASDSNVHVNINNGMGWYSWRQTPCNSIDVTAWSPMLGTLAVGGRCGVYRSTDNGLSWHADKIGLPERQLITALAAYPDEMLVAGVDGMGIYLRDNTSASIKDDISQIDALHITPNPLMISGMFRYRLDNRSVVHVTVYDALGRIVSQPVVDVMQESGEHQVVVNTEGLAPGVYVCSVKAGGVERMVRFVVVR